MLGSAAELVARLAPGHEVILSVKRDDVQLAIPFKVGRLPDPPSDQTQSGASDTWVPNLALGVANTTAQIRKSIKADDESGGLIVTQLRRAGPGAMAGLKVGDLITHAGTKRLQDVGDLASGNSPTTQSPLLIRVIRDGAPHFVAITGSDEP